MLARAAFQKMSEKSLDALKNALSAELARGKTDFAKITRLAAEITGRDSEAAAFSVSATIVRRLGEELVAKQETALGELVKNAYDADASEVTAIFSGQHKRHGRLIVRDNGNGMTPEQVRAGFLVISSDDKVLNPTSPIFSRRRAGQKGIGRFAVERLGKKVCIVTQTAHDPLATELTINWEEFEKSTDIANIRNRIRRVPKKRPQGTDLIIDQLREPWTVSQIQTAYNYVTDLIELPLKAQSEEPEHQRGDETETTNTFAVDFQVMEGVSPTSVLTPLDELLEYAVGYVEGRINSKHEWEFVIKSRVLDINDEHNKNTVDRDDFPWQLAKLSSVTFKAYYFNPSVEGITGVGKKKIQNDVRARSGVRLYRNGFRVPPYGNQGNDWLGFDESEAKRAILQPHGNKNWIGQVSVHDPNNKFINETSSREGVIENEFFQELQNFISKTLLTIVIRQGRVRKKKIYANDPVFGQARADRLQTKLKSAAKVIQDIKKIRASSSSTITKDAVTQSSIETLTHELEGLITESATLTSEIGMLRVLASMGLSVTLFSHEVRGVLSGTTTNIDKQIRENDLPAKYLARLKDLKKALVQLQTFTSYYDRAAAAAIDRTVGGIDLYPQIEDFKERFSEHARQRGTSVKVEADPDLPIRFVKIHEAEFAAILLNLFTNSMKAIAKVQPRQEGIIELRLKYEGAVATLEFMDNGCGIDPSVSKTMFEPFITTSTTVHQSKPGDPDSLGTGLGLTIVRDSVIAAGGRISPVTPPKGFATSFQLTFPLQAQ